MNDPSRRNETAARIPLADLASWLTPMLASDDAEEAVRNAAARLGSRSTTFTETDAERILEELAQAADIVGLAAKRAQAKRAARARQAVPGDPAPESRVAGATIDAEQIVTLLAAALGTDKAQKLVSAELQRAGLGDRLTQADAMRVLETLAAVPGLVGVTARFAKARFVLR